MAGSAGIDRDSLHDEATEGAAARLLSEKASDGSEISPPPAVPVEVPESRFRERWRYLFANFRSVSTFSSEGCPAQGGDALLGEVAGAGAAKLASMPSVAEFLEHISDRSDGAEDPQDRRQDRCDTMGSLDHFRLTADDHARGSVTFTLFQAGRRLEGSLGEVGTWQVCSASELTLAWDTQEPEFLVLEDEGRCIRDAAGATVQADAIPSWFVAECRARFVAECQARDSLLRAAGKPPGAPPEPSPSVSPDGSEACAASGAASVDEADGDFVTPSTRAGSDGEADGEADGAADGEAVESPVLKLRTAEPAMPTPSPSQSSDSSGGRPRGDADADGVLRLCGWPSSGGDADGVDEEAPAEPDAPLEKRRSDASGAAPSSSSRPGEGDSPIGRRRRRRRRRSSRERAESVIDLDAAERPRVSRGRSGIDLDAAERPRISRGRSAIDLDAAERPAGQAPGPTDVTRSPPLDRGASGIDLDMVPALSKPSKRSAPLDRGASGIDLDMVPAASKPSKRGQAIDLDADAVAAAGASGGPPDGAAAPSPGDAPAPVAQGIDLDAEEAAPAGWIPPPPLPYGTPAPGTAGHRASMALLWEDYLKTKDELLEPEPEKIKKKRPSGRWLFDSGSDNERWKPKREAKPPVRKKVCKLGTRCNNRNVKHLNTMAHPVDRHYEAACQDSGVEFHPLTLRQIFEWLDTTGTGKVTRQEINLAKKLLRRLGLIRSMASDEISDADWQALDRDGNQVLNFCEFTCILKGLKEDLNMPLGLDSLQRKKEKMKPCRVKGCPCEHVQLESGCREGKCLLCGHAGKDHKVRKASTTESVPFPCYWKNREGSFNELIPVAGADRAAALQEFQQLLDMTYEGVWTASRREFQGTVFVPSRLVVSQVYRNENSEKWKQYAVRRQQLVAQKKPIQVEANVASTVGYGRIFGGERAGRLERDVNEWYLWHGTAPEAARAIMRTDFRINFRGEYAGTRFGCGAYFAESCTKSDEYCHEVDANGSHTVMLCRVLGGNPRVIATREKGYTDKEDLQACVINGEYDSVIGDRQFTVGHYREFIVFDSEDIYPEYLLEYKKVFDEEPVQNHTAVCKHGARCGDRSPGHLKKCAHPCDQDYQELCKKLAVEPQPETIKVIFDRIDATGTGRLSRDELQGVPVRMMLHRLGFKGVFHSIKITDQMWNAWIKDGGEQLNFDEFASLLELERSDIARGIPPWRPVEGATAGGLDPVHVCMVPGCTCECGVAARLSGKCRCCRHPLSQHCLLKPGSDEGSLLPIYWRLARDPTAGNGLGVCTLEHHGPKDHIKEFQNLINSAGRRFDLKRIASKGFKVVGVTRIEHRKLMLKYAARRAELAQRVLKNRADIRVISDVLSTVAWLEEAGDKGCRLAKNLNEWYAFLPKGSANFAGREPGVLAGSWACESVSGIHAEDASKKETHSVYLCRILGGRPFHAGPDVPESQLNAGIVKGFYDTVVRCSRDRNDRAGPRWFYIADSEVAYPEYRIDYKVAHFRR